MLVEINDPVVIHEYWQAGVARDSDGTLWDKYSNWAAYGLDDPHGPRFSAMTLNRPAYILVDD